MSKNVRIKNFAKPDDLPSWAWSLQFDSGADMWSGWHKGYHTKFDAERSARRAANDEIRVVDVNPASGGLKFSQLSIGDTFKFDESDLPRHLRTDFADTEFEKISATRYIDRDDKRNHVYRVGTINTKVFTSRAGIADNPVTVRQSLGRFRGALSRREASEQTARLKQAILPPVYSLKSFTGSWRIGGYKVNTTVIKPAFPLQIMATDDVDIEFRFWGSKRYDVHEAFPNVKLNISINSISYCILVCDQYFEFEHQFKCQVKLTLAGIKGQKHIMKPYGQLEGLPVLPHDWQYFQFVN